MTNAERDQNSVPTLLGVSSVDGVTTMPVYVNPTTHRLLVDLSGGGSGTVTSVSVVTANGFAGTVATATTTPAITLTTSITGFLQGNGTAISAASTTGTGSTLVLSTSPVLVTPTLGVATATTINKVTITAPATGSTLTIADGKTLVVSNSLTFTGTDGNSFAFPSGSDTVVTLGASQTLTSKTLTSPVLTTPVINGTPTGTGVSATPAASIIALWDANKNLSANAFIPAFTTTATAAGTTALTIASTETQVFTGATTQTVTLPTTSVVAGGRYTIINNSTGAVTVQSSGANTIVILAAGTSAIFTAVVATPTTAANWDAQYLGEIIASGKSLTVNNSITLSGTDATTMTFPTTSKTIAANDGSNWTIASQAIGDLAVASSTTAYSRLAAVAVGSVLVSAGTGTAPAYSANPQVTTIELGAATDTTLARNAAGVISVEGEVLNGFTTTATAAGTTTLTIASNRTQYFTGSSTQTVKLPTTSVVVGQTYIVTNTSTGLVTVQSSGANTIVTLGLNQTATFTALVATPTTAANWSYAKINLSGNTNGKRLLTVTQSATPSMDTDNGDIMQMTGLAQAITSMTTNLTGTPNEGDIIEIQITDNATARAITWGASFANGGLVNLPTTTVLSVMLRVLLQRTGSVWSCIAVA